MSNNLNNNLAALLLNDSTISMNPTQDTEEITNIMDMKHSEIDEEEKISNDEKTRRFVVLVKKEASLSRQSSTQSQSLSSNAKQVEESIQSEITRHFAQKRKAGTQTKEKLKEVRISVESI